MIKKIIRNYALTLVIVLTFLTPTLMPAAAQAAQACSGTASGIESGANATTGGNAVNCGSTGVSNSSVGSIAKTIVNLFSIIVGAVSVIMIIYGGFRYITSGGDTTRVGNAKNTLIYAVIGLVVVALAQLIVHFVLNQTTTITNNGAVLLLRHI